MSGIESNHLIAENTSFEVQRRATHTQLHAPMHRARTHNLIWGVLDVIQLIESCATFRLIFCRYSTYQCWIGAVHEKSEYFAEFNSSCNYISIERRTTSPKRARAPLTISRTQLNHFAHCVRFSVLIISYILRRLSWDFGCRSSAGPTILTTNTRKCITSGLSIARKWLWVMALRHTFTHAATHAPEHIIAWCHSCFVTFSTSSSLIDRATQWNIARQKSIHEWKRVNEFLLFLNWDAELELEQDEANGKTITDSWTALAHTHSHEKFFIPFCFMATND